MQYTYRNLRVNPEHSTRTYQRPINKKEKGRSSGSSINNCIASSLAPRVNNDCGLQRARTALRNIQHPSTSSKRRESQRREIIFLRMRINECANKRGFDSSRHPRSLSYVRSCPAERKYVRGRDEGRKGEGGSDGQEGKSDGRTKRSELTRTRDGRRENPI